ncbi:hypothetical protein BH10BAC5_BH10BAC5_02000 [soil metagenome]
MEQDYNPTYEQLESYFFNDKDKYFELAEFYKKYNLEFYNLVFRKIEAKYKKEYLEYTKGDKTRIGPFIVYLLILIGIYAGYSLLRNETVRSSESQDGEFNYPSSDESLEKQQKEIKILEDAMRYKKWEENFINFHQDTKKNIYLFSIDGSILNVYANSINSELYKNVLEDAKDFHTVYTINTNNKRSTTKVWVDNVLVKTYNGGPGGVR